ncbi:hypothetical protein H9P43_005084 [Blastocladiella emersonii ATCC 22665]|nr:hypothetical protein H9P43_005084 [Blastocladiella emersonii ATCC 22665]
MRAPLLAFALLLAVLAAATPAALAEDYSYNLAAAAAPAPPGPPLYPTSPSPRRPAPTDSPQFLEQEFELTDDPAFPFCDELIAADRAKAAGARPLPPGAPSAAEIFGIGAPSPASGAAGTATARIKPAAASGIAAGPGVNQQSSDAAARGAAVPGLVAVVVAALAVL